MQHKTQNFESGIDDHFVEACFLCEHLRMVIFPEN